MLKIYITSIILSLIICEISVSGINKRLNREGYTKREKASFIEKVNGLMFAIVPLINIAVAIAFILNSEQMYNNIKAKYIEKYGGEK